MVGDQNGPRAAEGAELRPEKGGGAARARNEDERFAGHAGSSLCSGAEPAPRGSLQFTPWRRAGWRQTKTRPAATPGY